RVPLRSTGGYLLASASQICRRLRRKGLLTNFSNLNWFNPVSKDIGTGSQFGAITFRLSENLEKPLTCRRQFQLFHQINCASSILENLNCFDSGDVIKKPAA